MFFLIRLILSLILWIIYANLSLAQYHINRPKRVFPDFKFPSDYKDVPRVFEWKNLQYGFPSEHEQEQVLRNGRYNPDSPIPIDIDVYYPRKHRINISGSHKKRFLTTDNLLKLS